MSDQWGPDDHDRTDSDDEREPTGQHPADQQPTEPAPPSWEPAPQEPAPPSTGWETPAQPPMPQQPPAPPSTGWETPAQPPTPQQPPAPPSTGWETPAQPPTPQQPTGSEWSAGGWDPTDTGPTAPGQSEWAPGAPARPLEPALTLETEGEVRSRSGGAAGRVVAGVLGVLVLVAGSLFAVTQLSSSGPGSPEDAVREMLDAASNEDVLGLLAALDPGERETLRRPIEDLFSELKRLEVLDPSFELTGVAGLDIEFTDVELRSVPVRDDLVRVYFDGGTVTTGVRADDVPLGDFVHDTLERFETDIAGVEETETTPITPDDETFLVARNGSDGWRVSIGYTLAEIGRLDTGLPMLAGGMEAIGAESPEAAVEGLLRSMAQLDLSDAIARLSPDEMAALHDYAGLFIDDAQAALDAEARDLEITVDDVQLRAETSGDRASVFVDAFAVTVVFDGETVSLSVDGECFTIEGDMVEEELAGTPFANGEICMEELSETYTDMIGQFEAEAGFELPEFPPFEAPQIGITTAKVDGEWYVAPVATYLDGTVAVLQVLQRGHLDAMVDVVEQFFFGFGFSGETTFEEIGEGLGEDSYGFEEDFEDFDDFEDPTAEPGTEESFGTTQFSPEDFEVLHEIGLTLMGEDAGAQCVVAVLTTYADPFLVYELIDSWLYEYEPSDEASDALFMAVDQCRQSGGN